MSEFTTSNSPSSPSDRPRDADLFRQFVDYLFSRAVPRGAADSTIDWHLIEGAVEGVDSLEQSIGRAVVVADLLSRDLYSSTGQEPAAGPSPSHRPAFVPATLGRLAASHKRTTSLLLATALLMIALVVTVTTLSGPPPAAAPHAAPSQTIQGNAQLVSNAVQVAPVSASVSLTPATTPPAPAPPSLSDAPPLSPHEVFGFAPYWTLSESAGFDVSHISTLAYFSVGVNADGTLDESGPGWNGYQSQAFASLVTRAHAAGDRVVLTVNDFDQDSLNQLTSSPTAPATLASVLIPAIQSKQLDGVNFDFEGSGSGDQAGLTNLVTQVSNAVHTADPSYQVTMDTYASAAGDSSGFYNIRALAPAVDAFFVMAYQLNLQSGASPNSPLTSTAFSEKTAVDQYVAAVPPSKVILGMPYFGIDWPTTDGTLTAQATGPATTVTYGQVVASGHPIYWDSTTDTGWTSYQVGTQWHESFFEVPSSLYDAAQLANANGLGGVGIWALGMDGNDPDLSAALAGLSTVVKDYSGGPSATSPSSSTSTSTSTSTTTTTTTTVGSTSSTSTSTTAPSTSTTSTSPTTPTTSDPSQTASTTPTTEQATVSISTLPSIPTLRTPTRHESTRPTTPSTEP
jgi:hypothetical protein